MQQQNELLKIYPNSQEFSWAWLLGALLIALFGRFFVLSGLRSVVGRWLRNRGSGSSPFRGEPYQSQIYHVDQIRLAELPPGNCWRQLLYAAPTNSYVLDIGCSTGYLGKALAEERAFTRIDGIEADPKAASVAAEAYNHVSVGDLNVGDLWNEIPNHTYSLGLCMDVLEHLVEPDQMLIYLHSKLRTDGIVLASVPNVAEWQVRFELLRGRFDYTDLNFGNNGILDRTHLRFFTLQSIVNLFEKAGYQIEWVAATMPGWHSLYNPLKACRFGNYLRVALLRTFPRLLSRQFLIQARPV